MASKNTRKRSSTGGITRPLDDAIKQIWACDDILEPQDQAHALAAAKDCIRIAAQALNERMEHMQRHNKVTAPDGFWKAPNAKLVNKALDKRAEREQDQGVEIAKEQEREIPITLSPEFVLVD
jgi:hypothetical protein